jgi:hypothetical protein
MHRRAREAVVSELTGRVKIVPPIRVEMQNMEGEPDEDCLDDEVDEEYDEEADDCEIIELAEEMTESGVVRSEIDEHDFEQ